MEYAKLCDSEYCFMCVIWEAEPVSSGELVSLCQEKLGWKKSTTYTVLRKLCEKGYLENKETIVSALVSKEQVQAKESEEFVERTFDGSLPGFIAAFLGGRKISGEEAEALKQIDGGTFISERRLRTARMTSIMPCISEAACWKQCASS